MNTIEQVNSLIRQASLKNQTNKRSVSISQLKNSLQTKSILSVNIVEEKLAHNFSAILQYLEHLDSVVKEIMQKGRRNQLNCIPENQNQHKFAYDSQIKNLNQQNQLTNQQNLSSLTFNPQNQTESQFVNIQSNINISNVNTHILKNNAYLTVINKHYPTLSVQPGINDHILNRIKAIEAKTGCVYQGQQEEIFKNYNNKKTDFNQQEKNFNDIKEKLRKQNNNSHNFQLLSMQSDIKVVKQKLQKLDIETQNALGMVQEKLQNLQPRIQEITTLEEKINSLLETTSKQNEQFEDLSRKLASSISKNQSKFSKINQNIQELKAQINVKIYSQNAHLQRQINLMEIQINSHSQILTQIGANIQNISDNLSQGQNEIKQNRLKIQTMNEIIEKNLSKRLSKLENMEQINNEKIANLISQKVNIDDYTKQKSQIHHLKSNIKKMQEKITDLQLTPKSYIKNNETKLSDLSGLDKSSNFNAIQFTKQLDNRIKKVKQEIMKYFMKNNYLNNQASTSDSEKIMNLSDRVAKLEKILNDKVNESTLKKISGSLEFKIKSILKIMADAQENNQDASLVRRKWYCLSCQAMQQQFEGKIGKYAPGNAFKAKAIKQDAVGGGMHMNTSLKQHQSANLKNSYSLTKMPKINKTNLQS